MIKGNLKFKNNMEVDIDNVLIMGTLDFNNQCFNDQCIKNQSININNIIFNAEAEIDSKEYCINLFGNVNISNSLFYGNSLCKNGIMKYDGENMNNIKIDESYFDGNYSNQCLKIINSLKSFITSSKFEKGASFKTGGGAIGVEYSDLYVESCEFSDNFSVENGAIFYVYNSKSFETQNIIAQNTTALEKGSFIYIYSSSDYKTKASIYNTQYYGVGNINQPINNGGLIASIEGFSNLYIENFYGEDLNGGNGVGAFTISQESVIEINNIELHKVDASGIGGVLLTSFNEEVGSKFKVTNGNFTDFSQYSASYASTFIMIDKNIEISINDSYISNLFCYRGYFMYNEGPAMIEFNNVNILYHSSNSPTYFFYNKSYNKDTHNTLTLNNVRIDEYSSCEEFITMSYGEIIINNSNFNMFWRCTFSIECIITNKDEKLGNEISGFIDIGENVKLIISDTVFDSIYANGFKAGKSSYITISDTTFQYCGFSTSLIEIDTNSNNKKGHYIINNTNFIGFFGYNGSILSIIETDNSTPVTFNNSSFIENISTNCGGIVYSQSNSTNLYVSFNNCVFENNWGLYGHIAYSYSKQYEPYFSNIEELREIEGSFVTNPAYIQLTNDSPNSISIISGEVISEEIKYNIFDDYGNLRKITESLDIKYVSSVNEMVYFKVYINDTYNAAIIGKAVSFCLYDECTLPSFKIVGNPGNYKLNVEIIIYGPFKPFSNNLIEMDLTIKNCDESYIYQDLYNIGFKSCYFPECSPSCNNGGKCINTNVCDCSKTSYHGNYCNEYYKLNRIKFVDKLIIFITIVLVILILIIMLSIFLLRNESKIKAGGIDFMYIILFGLLFNCIYVYESTIENKTKFNCIMSFLSNNIVIFNNNNI
ncbi:hypothetical protein BCR36DRAFT_353422 [Piromyces finnis]|uniref:EGF-like domain-containing protein n=1 Tax=Piromyces finnis TaxID=1754191 RepID=A0A1Y1V8M5_9FUNG|nr:hypothetical protein BCR36DRAFT_353422 [Piromyces finnis]|eukprot:ORX49720.1 hypothetical protein BCR36DRAFT_353422 [Piromyces finnis]